MFPNVFTGQPTAAPGIIQHYPSAPTSDPSSTAAAVAPQQAVSLVKQPTGAYLGCPGGCEDVSLKDVAPFALPGWAKIAAAILLIGGAGTAIYFGTRE